MVKALGDREGPDTGRRRLLKVLTSGLFGMAAGLGWIGVEGGHRDKKGLARGEVPGIRTWHTVGTERKLLADAQTRTATLSRADGLAIDAAKSFAWERSTLVEYEGGAAVVVPAIDSHQTELERTYLLLGYDTRHREIGGALLLAMRRRSTDDDEPAEVDFATLSGTRSSASRWISKLGKCEKSSTIGPVPMNRSSCRWTAANLPTTITGTVLESAFGEIGTNSHGTCREHVSALATDVCSRVRGGDVRSVQGVLVGTPRTVSSAIARRRCQRDD